MCDCEREWVRLKWAVASLDAATTVPARKGSFESEGKPGRLCDSTKGPALCGKHWVRPWTARPDVVTTCYWVRVQSSRCGYREGITANRRSR